MKKILKGYKARQEILKGINEAVDAVEPTLGAVGMSAMIDLGGDFYPVESDDGITVLKSLRFKDRYKQMGMLLVRKASNRTNEEGGDGTSTTASISRALCNEVHKLVGKKHYKVAEVVERLQTGLKEIVEDIQLYSHLVSDEDIERVATISSLDPEIGKIIAEVYKEIGRDGVVTVEDSNTIGYSSEIVKGTRFKKGYISPYFINDPNKAQTVLQNAYVMIIDRRIGLNNQIENIMKKVIATGNNNIIVLADNVEGEALATLVANHQTKVLNIVCVQPPHTMELKREWYKDIATLTGATVISEEAGMLVDNTELHHLGFAEKVIVTKDTTTIVNGGGIKEKIEERVESLKLRLDESKSETDKEVLKERIASLTGGFGVIRVGAITDTELRAKKYKIEDAVNATKAALAEGVVVGGGACLAKIAKTAKDPIFKKALLAPIKRMAVNAGIPDVWYNDKVSKLVKEVQLEHSTFGYDFKKKEFVNMLEEGIIDPSKVTRLAVESAVSVTLSFIRGETIIVEDGTV